MTIIEYLGWLVAIFDEKEIPLRPYIVEDALYHCGSILSANVRSLLELRLLKHISRCQ
jgi:hypothetical protein